MIRSIVQPNWQFNEIVNRIIVIINAFIETIYSRSTLKWTLLGFQLIHQNIHLQKNLKVNPSEYPDSFSPGKGNSLHWSTWQKWSLETAVLSEFGFSLILQTHLAESSHSSTNSTIGQCQIASKSNDRETRHSKKSFLSPQCTKYPIFT